MMARQTFSLLLFATATVAVFGFTQVRTKEPCEVETPENFERLKTGQLSHEYDSFYITDTAHHNLFAEIPEIARLNPFPHAAHLHFEDFIGNYISISPATRSTYGSLDLGTDKNRMSFFPSDYDSYDIDIDTMTADDLDIIEQWSMAAKIHITSERLPSKEVMQRIEVLRRSRNLVFVIRK